MVEKTAEKNNFKNKNDIFVDICNSEGELYAYKKQSDEDKTDIFDI